MLSYGHELRNYAHSPVKYLEIYGRPAATYKLQIHETDFETINTRDSSKHI